MGGEEGKGRLHLHSVRSKPHAIKSRSACVSLTQNNFACSMQTLCPQVLAETCVTRETTQNSAVVSCCFGDNKCVDSDLFADVVRDIVRNCEFKTLKANSVIIRQGEKGDWCASSFFNKTDLFLWSGLLVRFSPSS